MAEQEKEPFARWDTTQIALDQAKYMKEQFESEGSESFIEQYPAYESALTEDGFDEDEAFQIACGDSDLYDIELEDFYETLTEAMKEINGDEDGWMASAQNIDWRGRGGEKRFTATTGKELLDAIRPNTDEITVHVWRDNKTLRFRIAHHDVPMGGSYTVEPTTPIVYWYDTGDHPNEVKITREERDILRDLGIIHIPSSSNYVDEYDYAGGADHENCLLDYLDIIRSKIEIIQLDSSASLQRMIWGGYIHQPTPAQVNGFGGFLPMATEPVTIEDLKRGTPVLFMTDLRSVSYYKHEVRFTFRGGEAPTRSFSIELPDGRTAELVALIYHLCILRSVPPNPMEQLEDG